MNLAMSIAVYASISKELGLPLWFPGIAVAPIRQLFEATDAVHWPGRGLGCQRNLPALIRCFNINQRRLFPLGALVAQDRRLFRHGRGASMPITASPR